MHGPIHGGAAAHAHQATLRATADELTTIAERLERHVDGMQFRGPAADRFRGATSDRAHRLRHIGRELQDLAAVVSDPIR